MDIKDKINIYINDTNLNDNICYYLSIDIININKNNECYRNSLLLDTEIIEFFNIPKKYYIDSLLSFNAFYINEELYFKNKQDIEKVKEWIESNLDYFLMLRKLGGS